MATGIFTADNITLNWNEGAGFQLLQDGKDTPLKDNEYWSNVTLDNSSYDIIYHRDNDKNIGTLYRRKKNEGTDDWEYIKFDTDEDTFGWITGTPVVGPEKMAVEGYIETYLKQSEQLILPNDSQAVSLPSFDIQKILEFINHYNELEEHDRKGKFKDIQSTATSINVRLELPENKKIQFESTATGGMKFSGADDEATFKIACEQSLNMLLAARHGLKDDGSPNIPTAPKPSFTLKQSQYDETKQEWFKAVCSKLDITYIPQPPVQTSKAAPSAPSALDLSNDGKGDEPDEEEPLRRSSPGA